MRWTRLRRPVRRVARARIDFASVLMDTIPQVLLGERRSVCPAAWSALLSTTARLTPQEAQELYLTLANVAFGNDAVAPLGALGPTVVQHRERFLRFFLDNGKWMETLADVMDAAKDGTTHAQRLAVADARRAALRETQLRVAALQAELSTRALQFDAASELAYRVHAHVVRGKWPGVAWDDPPSVPVSAWSGVRLAHEPEDLQYALCYACRNVPCMRDRLADARARLTRQLAKDSSSSALRSHASEQHNCARIAE